MAEAQAAAASAKPEGEAPPALSELHEVLARVERHTHPHLLNRIANDPSVYPSIKGYLTGRLDFASVLADQRNVLLMGEFGGVMFVFLQPGFYEAHTLMLPAGRGEWALKTVRACLHWMFTRTDALEISTRAPSGNLAAHALARAVGGTQEFVVKKGWVMDGDPVPAAIFFLTIQSWMKSAPGLEERGAWFHSRLEEEYLRFGKAEQQHEHDAVHDRYVGAACEMFLGGQPIKATVFYNRFAVMAGYALCALASVDPIKIDIRDSVLTMRDDNFEVTECRWE